MKLYSEEEAGQMQARELRVSPIAIIMHPESQA